MRTFKLIFLTICLSAMACTKSGVRDSVVVEVLFDSGTTATKSQDPKDEDLLSDLNLFVYDRSGHLEEQVWLDRRAFGREAVSLPLLCGVEYDIVACLNFGYRISGVESINKLMEKRFFMAYPDEFADGLPMMALRQRFRPEESGGTLLLEAERLMAKIILRMDRSRLANGITMNVTGAEIHGCPRSVAVFQDSKPLGESDVFLTGYTKEGAMSDNLNRAAGEGLSAEVCLYMLENMSGSVNEEDLPPTAPYLELRLSYNSPERYSLPGENLVYRFALGAENGKADIRRNRIYRYTIRPDKDGLGGEGSWRVDTEALAYYP